MITGRHDNLTDVQTLRLLELLIENRPVDITMPSMIGSDATLRIGAIVHRVRADGSYSWERVKL